MFTRDPGYLPSLVRLKEHEKKVYYQSHNFYMDFSKHEYTQSVNRNKFNKYGSGCKISQSLLNKHQNSLQEPNDLKLHLSHLFHGLIIILLIFSI